MREQRTADKEQQCERTGRKFVHQIMQLQSHCLATRDIGVFANPQCCLSMEKSVVCAHLQRERDMNLLGQTDTDNRQADGALTKPYPSPAGGS